MMPVSFPSSKTTGHCLLALFILTVPIRAEDDTQFGFDLFSDIAPILALFGEQFARQFMSESLNWLDHLIAALVPLGILTIITGAIRVSGPQVAKSFIGRARENRALAEIELMSSTSQEVCELFNGRSIVRAMGKPKIAEFLIFPSEYNRLEDEYTKLDEAWHASKGSEALGIHNDNSCGIHSLETARYSKGGTGKQLMEYGAYHSYSFHMMQLGWGRVKSGFQAFLPSSPWLRFPVQRLLTALHGRWGRMRTDSRASESTTADPGPERNLERVTPPNLQLNLSSDHFSESRIKKRHELFLAAITAIILQAGLVAIAVITVYHEPTRESLGSAHKPWGLPCYIVGTILLSIGIGICSRSVERSTTEKVYKIPGGWSTGRKTAEELYSSPRLLWLQQNQTVNDQSFSGYTILAGPKRRVVTSRRYEDEQRRPSRDDISNASYADTDESDERREKDSPEDHDDKTSTLWKGLTVAGVTASAVGFIGQFFGLRGLAFPCSIAQLLAILVMALIRAGIRRRLGRIPAHCPVIPKYELDCLATQITFSPNFRTFHHLNKSNELYTGHHTHNKIYQWAVALPQGLESDKRFYFVHPTDPPEDRDEEAPRAETGGLGMETMELDDLMSPPKHAAASFATRIPILSARASKKIDGPSFEEATSQQLLKVRERLGNLCRWTSPASETALSLVHAIELFMDTFFPPAPKQAKNDLDFFDWVIQTENPSLSDALSAENPDFIFIPARRSSNGKWTVDVGKADAALSLWMATIEAQVVKKREKIDRQPERAKTTEASGSTWEPDWRRIKAATGMKLPFYRILGTDFEDGVLRRDLSWWVDELALEQVHSKSPDEGYGLVDFVIGFSGRPRSIDARRKSASSASLGDLGVMSNGFLPAILAQQLFTSFMWNISPLLPMNCLRSGYTKTQQDVDIESSDAFSPYDLPATWHRPKMRHRHLSKIAQQMHAAGLGSMNQIFFCMIPALSFHDLLPNHAILGLLPNVGQGQGWEDTAHCYNRLLESSIRAGRGGEERFCFHVVVDVTDFIYLACDPYSGSNLPPSELGLELKGLALKLTSSKFSSVVSKLAPIYNLQYRRLAFVEIFKRYKRTETTEADSVSILDLFSQDNYELDPDFLRDTLGFTKMHYLVSGGNSGTSEDPFQPSIFSARRRPELEITDGGDPKTPDIFGWTPLHYGFLTRDDWIEGSVTDYIEESKEGLRIHTLVDNIGRNPIHIAVSSGELSIARASLDSLTEEERKLAFTNGALDGMTLLHIAVKSGNSRKLDSMLRSAQILHLELIDEKDVWGRQAIHIAAGMGNSEISRALMSKGSSLHQVDKRGKSPVDYLLRSGSQDGSNDGNMFTDSARERISRSNDSKANQKNLLSISRCAILQEFALSLPDYRNGNGETFLHLAARYANVDTVKALLGSEKFTKSVTLDDRDSARYTPLHCAILERNTGVALTLLDEFHADPSAKSMDEKSVLMCAVSKNMGTVVERLFAKKEEAEEHKRTNEVDIFGERALAACNPMDRDFEGRTALHYAADIDTPSALEEVAQLRIVNLLTNKGYDPITRDNGGMTALQVAVQRRKEAMAIFLLMLIAEPGPSTPQDDAPETQRESQNPEEDSPVSEARSRDTLLIMACRSQCSCVIPSILELWPNIINEADLEYDQPPLSWACELGDKGMVQSLLGFPGLDINRRSGKWRGYTPLHFAVAAGDADILGLMLEKEDADVHATNAFGETPIAMAVSRGSPVCVMPLLLHRNTTDEERISYLDKLPLAEYEEIESAIAKVIEQVKDQSVSDDQLQQIFEATDSRRELKSVFKVLIGKLLRRGTWKRARNLYHRAVKVGSLEIIESLTAAGGDPAELDEDQWSCLDLANRLGHGEEFTADLKRHVEEHRKVKDESHRPLAPSTLQPLAGLEANIQITPHIVEEHIEYTEVEVLTPTESQDRACFRADHPIPPLTPESEHFYFEVTVLKESTSRILGIGFCDPFYDTTGMPGWFSGSWAYHGDDGHLFIESGFHRSPVSQDFGLRGQFGAGDTAGVYFNLMTGEAFCTLNGKRLDMGPSFALKRLTRGKVYPCVGVSASQTGKGLHFRVNFGTSVDGYPFMYKGVLRSPLMEEYLKVKQGLGGPRREWFPHSVIRRFETRKRELEERMRAIDLEASRGFGL